MTWAETWGMEFNIQKCNILSVTWKKKNKKAFTYKMRGQRIQGIRDTKYLGVTLNEKLKWDTHISRISSEANRMLGLLWRNLKFCPKNFKETAYKSYVRPKLEYCSNVWDPHTQKDVKKIEMVQRRAARFVTNTPHHKQSAEHVSITKTIKDLGWQPLSERRKNNRIIMLYRIVNYLVDIPQSYHPKLRHPQPVRGNQYQYQRPAAEIEVFEHSFLPRTIKDWNNLSSTVVAVDSLESLRRHLF